MVGCVAYDVHGQLTRNFWRWHFAGILGAFAFSIASASLGLAPDGVLVTVGSAVFFLVGGTPIELAFLGVWIQLAKRWPIIEARPHIRFPLLITATLLSTLGVLWMLSVAPLLSGEHWTFEAALERFTANGTEVIFLCVLFAAWAVLPRLVVRSLRGPLSIPADTRDTASAL